jgi:hypothetical protein
MPEGFCRAFAMPIPELDQTAILSVDRRLRRQRVAAGELFEVIRAGRAQFATC